MRVKYENFATNRQFSSLLEQCNPWPPSGVGMRLSAYFGKRLHRMLSWTYVHV